ncbi:hypothetical protein HDE78_003359 [Rhodanobacter sp. K2T2]|uniref:hypothetical protein n=1 Tax=Rhodanobacter sp. K2T2 TaxID=2723085 RepID=UPI0015CDAA5B|nr:hypothetical protein [Rhodanobacter sp. K2T2]NYE30390.1 hypothetical protein [Rhodanobacter sp. K2T2]
MDVAFCREDSKEYDAYSFSQLSRATLERKRRLLICPECKGIAFFRRESSDGRAACFGARPHADTCSLAGSEAGDWGTDGSDVEDERRNAGDHIVIDLSYGADADGPDGAAGGDRRHAGAGRTFTGSGMPRQSRSQKRLSTLLRWLVKSENFRQSTQVIELPGRITLPANQLFVPFDRIDASLRAKFHGFWGMISDATASKGVVWLNTSGHKGFSVMIETQSAVDAFKKRYSITSLEQLAGAYVLVFAQLVKSGKTDKLFSRVDDIGYIVVNIADTK